MYSFLVILSLGINAIEKMAVQSGVAALPIPANTEVM
jgi:hypothetical protein